MGMINSCSSKWPYLAHKRLADAFPVGPLTAGQKLADTIVHKEMNHSLAESRLAICRIEQELNMTLFLFVLPPQDSWLGQELACNPGAINP